MTTNLYEISRWKLTLWTRNRKFTRSTGRGYQDDNWWYHVSCWAHAKENIFNLFDILKKKWQYYANVGLYYYRCLKNWMVKIWWTFGQSSSQIHQIFTPLKFLSVRYLFFLNGILFLTWEKLVQPKPDQLDCSAGPVHSRLIWAVLYKSQLKPLNNRHFGPR